MTKLGTKPNPEIYMIIIKRSEVPGGGSIEIDQAGAEISLNAAEAIINLLAEKHLGINIRKTDR